MRTGNLIIATGVAVVIVGVCVRLGLFAWFGRLPGDIRTSGERVTIFFPVTSMLILSVVGSIVLSLIWRAFGDR